MGKTGWMAGVAAAVLLGGFGVGNAVAQTTVYVGHPKMVVQQAPVRTWVPGHWEGYGRSRVWVDGHWVVSRPRHANAQPHWRGHPGQHVQPAHPGWDRVARNDHDRDGIPNRHDRDLDNDGIPNHRDADRDGDRVPNWRDHAPDNRFRR